MKFKASLLCIPVLIFVSAGLPSTRGAEEEAEKVYTLRESINEALENNRSLKAKEEQIYQATQVKNQARSEFLPKFSTIYGYTRLNEVKTFKSSLGGDIAISSRNNFQSVTSVRQPLFRGFALLSSFELAKLGIDQSEMQVDLDKLDLALQVKEPRQGADLWFRMLGVDGRNTADVGDDVGQVLIADVREFLGRHHVH